MSFCPRSKFALAGFTLVEVLISTAIICLLGLILVSITNQTSDLWRRTSGKIEQFREARAAFESITTKVSQATLNTYWDYDNPTTPTRYERRSELRFISGQANSPTEALLGNTSTESGETASRVTQCVFFHAPLGVTEAADYRGLETLLNVWGYYIEFRDDRKLGPGFVTDAISPPRYRFRLMEYMQPSENLATYGYTSGTSGGIPLSSTYLTTEWFKNGVNALSPPSRPVAENIIALIITPRLSRQDEQEVKGASAEIDSSPLAPNYSYNSALSKNAGQVGGDARVNPKNQLPPVLHITMVAIDEGSASRLKLDKTKADIFKVSNKFTDTSKYTSDLVYKAGAAADTTLENTMIDKKVSYRIFTSNVPIRAAKWSREQTN